MQMSIENNVTHIVSVDVNNPFEYKIDVTDFFPVNEFLSVSNKTHKKYLSILSSFRDNARNPEKKGCTPFMAVLANLMSDVDPRISICDNKSMKTTYKQASKLGELLFPSELRLEGTNIPINYYRLLVANNYSTNPTYANIENDVIFHLLPPISYKYRDFLGVKPEQNYVTGIPAISKALYSNLRVTQQTVQNCATYKGKKFNADKAICFVSYALSMFCIFSNKKNLVNNKVDHYKNYSISYYGTDKYIIKALKSLTS